MTDESVDDDVTDNSNQRKGFRATHRSARRHGSEESGPRYPRFLPWSLCTKIKMLSIVTPNLVENLKDLDIAIQFAK